MQLSLSRECLDRWLSWKPNCPKLLKFSLRELKLNLLVLQSSRKQATNKENWYKERARDHKRKSSREVVKEKHVTGFFEASLSRTIVEVLFLFCCLCILLMQLWDYAFVTNNIKQLNSCTAAGTLIQLMNEEKMAHK